MQTNRRLVMLVAGLMLAAGGNVPLADAGQELPEPKRRQNQLVETSEQKDQALDAVITNSIGMKFRRIPPGRFAMGSPNSAEDSRADEKPQHTVRITRAFYLGVYEVTQQEYRQVLRPFPFFFSPSGPGKNDVLGENTDRFPAEQVIWTEAIEFCRRLSEKPAEKKAGRAYRLPTEAEWEYACRAGTTTTFHFGDRLTSTAANINGRYPYGGAQKGPFLRRPTEVGTHAPNAFGLYDMHGNVWEWCADRYGSDYYRNSPMDDPQGPETGTSRVIRGGGWRSDARDCRSAFRHADLPRARSYAVGFRVVLTTPADAERFIRRHVIDSVTARSGRVMAADEATLRRHRRAMQQGEDWPRWRGVHADGTWNGPKLLEEWQETGLKTLWRQTIGGGYSGVVVSRGRAYVTDHQSKPRELERVLCFDALTGEPIWTDQYAARYGDLQYGTGPRSTPAIVDGRLYAVGAVGHLRCLAAASGQLIWSKDLVRDYKARMPIWGFSSSPLIFENLLILEIGGLPDAGVIALDRRTGKEVWRNLSDKTGYATPIVIDRDGSKQLICWTPSHIRGLDPSTGRSLWAVPFEVTYGTSIATPVFREDTVLVSGYWEGSKAVRLGKDTADATVLWQERRNLRGLMAQPLYRNGLGYMIDKRHGLTCFDWKTGKKLWDDDNRMTPKGRNPQASMAWLGNSDRVIVLNSDGELVLARIDRSGYHEQSRTKIIGPTWAHPAFAGGCVYARNDSELVCVSLLERNPVREK